MNEIRSHLFPILSQMAYRGGFVAADHDTDAIKSVLTRLGVNQRGWRMLLNFGELLFAPLQGALMHERRPLAAIENLAAFLRLVQQCEMDVPPPPELSRAWAHMKYPSPADDLCEVPVGLFRAAWIETVRRQYRGGTLRELLENELPAVLDWYFRADQVRVLDCNQLRSPWAWFRQRQQEWRERCTHRRYLDEWVPMLTHPVERQGLRVIELLAAQAVIDEAQVMRHCIDAYTDACESDDYRVFSIRHVGTGERVATFGIFEYEERWVIEDVRGQNNVEMDESLWAIAEEVLRWCNESPSVSQTPPSGKPLQSRLLQEVRPMRSQTGF